MKKWFLISIFITILNTGLAENFTVVNFIVCSNGICAAPACDDCQPLSSFFIISGENQSSAFKTGRYFLSNCMIHYDDKAECLYVDKGVNKYNQIKIKSVVNVAPDIKNRFSKWFKNTEGWFCDVQSNDGAIVCPFVYDYSTYKGD